MLDSAFILLHDKNFDVQATEVMWHATEYIAINFAGYLVSCIQHIFSSYSNKNLDDMQFEFMPGKGMIDAALILRRSALVYNQLLYKTW